jgi:hypothetical protein
MLQFHLLKHEKYPNKGITYEHTLKQAMKTKSLKFFTFLFYVGFKSHPLCTGVKVTICKFY